MKCLWDTVNNVQAYMSTSTEYKFDVDIELLGEVQLLHSVGKDMGMSRELVHIDWDENKWYQMLTPIQNKNNFETCNFFL